MLFTQCPRFSLRKQQPHRQLKYPYREKETINIRKPIFSKIHQKIFRIVSKLKLNTKSHLGIHLNYVKMWINLHSVLASMKLSSSLISPRSMEISSVVVGNICLGFQRLPILQQGCMNQGLNYEQPLNVEPWSSNKVLAQSTNIFFKWPR